METFERSLLEFLLKVYDLHVFVRHERPEKDKIAVEEMRKALFKPHVMKCYVSRGHCCYSLSPHQAKKCVGFDKCIIAIMKKREERGIAFK